MKTLTKILNRFTGSLIFEAEVSGETESIRLGMAVKLAIAAKANLRWANLSAANLSAADLYAADLRSADLRSANLCAANLESANLESANLYAADLRSANLESAYLESAYLRSANLESDCKLIGSRPVFQIGPIGSRSAYLMAFFTDGGIIIRTGCFQGTIEEFKKSVNRDHEYSVHGQEYLAAAALIEKHAELWTPKLEEVP